MSAPKRLRDGVPAGAVLSRADAQAIAERTMRFSKADGIDVNITSNHNTNVRFADNQMSTAGSLTDVGLVVQSWFGSKHAVVTTNDLSEASLRRCVEQSEVLARLAPDDPEAMPLIEPQTYQSVDAAYSTATEAIGAAERAQAAMTALGPARARAGPPRTIPTGGRSTSTRSRRGRSTRRAHRGSRRPSSPVATR
jgi:predicted Zn-dependent protease